MPPRARIYRASAVGMEFAFATVLLYFRSQTLHPEEPMAKAYWIACYRSVSNPAALADYAKLAGPAITASGGRILARGGTAKTYEAGIDQRTVLIEFDSVAQAIAAHDSPAYQTALAALGNAAERDIRIVESVD